MPYNPNDPNFQTKNSRILNFNDFEENIGREKEELKKVNRSFQKPDSEMNQTPGNPKFKYNKVTHKIDTLSKSEVEDNIEAIEDMGVEDKDHKYKIVEGLTDMYIPTAYDFSENYEIPSGSAQDFEEVYRAMIDFAKLHVKNAVGEIIRSENDRISDVNELEKLTDDVLRNLYPLENIK